MIAFTPWFELYYILRAALGFFSISVVFSGFVLTIELVGGRWRTVTGVCYMFPVSIGYISGTGIAWLLRDWRQLQLAMSLPGFLFMGLWYVQNSKIISSLNLVFCIGGYCRNLHDGYWQWANRKKCCKYCKRHLW